MARSTPRRKNRRSSRIWGCTIRLPTSLPKRVSCTSRTGCGSSSMPAPRRRGSFRRLRPDTGGPLDLSFSVLRSVSPIHLEYMANMGVRASMSISLVVRDRLWGLISCLNHTGPRRVPHEMRAACEFLGRLTSLQIAALEDRELLALRASRRATEDALAEAMRESPAEETCSRPCSPTRSELMGLVGAEGAAVVGAGESVTCGRTPPPELIQEIAAWVERRGGLRPFSTASLGALFPRALRPATSPAGCSRSLCPARPSGDSCGSAQRSSRR